MSYTYKFAAAVIGLLLLAIVASRQLFLSAVVRDAPGLLGSAGGRYHLWLAASAAIAACIAGFFMFYFFVRRQRIPSPKSPVETQLTASSDNQSNKSITAIPFDAMHSQRLNPWLSEGQADDRTPMNGCVAASDGSASEQRAFARRSHQIMFKKWSQARHY